LAEVKRQEKIERVVGFTFSRSGFTGEAEDYCREMGIAYSKRKRRQVKFLSPPASLAN
jgi:hypothetical protein